jgi:epoxyqueuosine reductase
MKSIDFDTLTFCASSVGLSLIAVLDRPDLELQRGRLQSWQDAGYAGEMSYMTRDPQLLTTPAQLFPALRSVVVVGVHYDRGEREALKAGFGRIARYAWGRDYHKVLRARLASLVKAVEQVLQCSVSHRVFSDSVPLLERALANNAGLGFVGKNTMVITPRLGSFMFLGEVLWELEVVGIPDSAHPKTASQDDVSPHHGKSRCGSCSRCLDECPTGAFVSEYVLDARRCISYLTIEKRGALTVQERRWLGEWIFGCDVCQEVCPFNTISIKARKRADCRELDSGAGVGQALSLGEVLGLRSDKAFIARFAGTALMRAKREGLLRNAAIVAANTAAECVVDSLEAASREDPSPVVRQHALWSHWELCALLGSGARQRSVGLLESCRSDPNEGVRSEVESCLGT